MVVNHTWHTAWVIYRNRWPASNPVIEFRDLDEIPPSRVQLWRDGAPLTAPLYDDPDIVAGYRYVDVFHMAHAVVLGWSPNTARLLGIAGDASETTELSRDQGIEDAISVLTLTYANEVGHAIAYADIVDPDLIAQTMNIAQSGALEFAAADWEHAAAAGIEAWVTLVRGECRSIKLDFAAHALRPIGTGACR